MRKIGGSAASNTLAIIVASLGYFVDVFDIWLYSSLRKSSLEGLGYTGTQVKSIGEMLLNFQMAGFIVGAILFGIVADRKGRLTVLFSSILTYSLANIANGFVHDVNLYAACRFVAGVGLAGELGAGIALVSELVSKEKRGWATTFVATVGVFGSVAAPLIAKSFDWRTAYFIGGGMGLLLLLMRVGVLESGMFENVKDRDDVKRGDFRHLFETKDRRRRYLAIILAGVPVWYFAGALMTFNAEVQQALGIANPAKLPDVIAIGALGLCFGDILFGALSQQVKSRRKAFFVAYGWMILAIAALFTLCKTGDAFYWTMFIGGLGAGYWAVFVTTSGEIFGTNLRGTVATTAPSFVRGIVIPISICVHFFEPKIGYIATLSFIGAIVFSAAIWAVSIMPETFHHDMNFVEE